MKNTRRKIDEVEYKRHTDDATSVMLWAKENLAPNGDCIYYQPQDVRKNQVRN